MSKNDLTKEKFSILEEKHKLTLMRLFSSDGASIIDRNGNVLSFGSVIDISNAKIEGVKGTGESVSSLLSQNGISVKVSQDGTIKLFGLIENKTIVI